MYENHGIKIFSGSNSELLSMKISEDFGQPLGALKLHKFKDGEFLPEILETVRGSHVFFIQSLNPPSDNLMELLLMIDAAKRASAYKVIAVVPYYGFARQDRKDKPRVSIGAKLVANMLVAAGVDRIISLDLHAPQIQGFFDIPFDHLESSVLFFQYIEHCFPDKSNLIFASPDIGSAHRVREVAVHFKTEMVICDKYRRRANEVEDMTLIGDVMGKDVIILDDICDTANTLVKAAELMKKRGAASVQAFCTHPILSDQAIERVNQSPLSQLTVTDTIPVKVSSPKLKVISTANLFAVAIRNAWENKSINSLFMKDNRENIKQFKLF